MAVAVISTANSAHNLSTGPGIGPSPLPTFFAPKPLAAFRRPCGFRSLVPTVDHARALTRTGPGGARGQQVAEYPSLLSSVSWCPAPPVSTHAFPGLPCPGSARPQGPAPTRNTLPKCRLSNHLTDDHQAPVTTPAAALPPRLARSFTPSVTSVGSPEETHTTPGMYEASAPPQFPRPCRGLDFRSQNTEAAPYPS